MSEKLIEFTRPVYGDEWELRARLKGQPDSFSRDATESDLRAAGYVKAVELEKASEAFRLTDDKLTAALDRVTELEGELEISRAMHTELMSDVGELSTKVTQQSDQLRAVTAERDALRELADGLLAEDVRLPAWADSLLAKLDALRSANDDVHPAQAADRGAEHYGVREFDKPPGGTHCETLFFGGGRCALVSGHGGPCRDSAGNAVAKDPHRNYNECRDYAVRSRGVCCIACDDRPLLERTMVVCSMCGNKRCPKAEDHRFKCTNSNHPNQLRVLEDPNPAAPAESGGEAPLSDDYLAKAERYLDYFRHDAPERQKFHDLGLAVANVVDHLKRQAADAPITRAELVATLRWAVRQQTGQPDGYALSLVADELERGK
jgi:hypothetical protein